MEVTTWTIPTSLIGGFLIGFSLLLMIVFNGKIAGTSGVLGGVLIPNKPEVWWKSIYIVGMLLGGLVLRAAIRWIPVSVYDLLHMNRDQILPTSDSQTPLPLWAMLLGGFLVGFGTRYGNGCTSGHGLCGLARISPRSIVATTSFFVTGIVVASAVSMTSLW